MLSYMRLKVTTAAEFTYTFILSIDLNEIVFISLVVVGRLLLGGKIPIHKRKLAI